MIIRAELSDDEGVILKVFDTGPGLDQDIESAVLDPFVTAQLLDAWSRLSSPVPLRIAAGLETDGAFFDQYRPGFGA